MHSISNASEKTHLELLVMHEIQRELPRGRISRVAGEKKQWSMPAAEHWLHSAFERDDDGSTVHCRHSVVQRRQANA